MQDQKLAVVPVPEELTSQTVALDHIMLNMMWPRILTPMIATVRKSHVSSNQ